MIPSIDDSPSEDARAADARAFRGAFLRATLIVAVIWWVKLIEHALDTSFAPLGVRPHDAFGLIGILAGPLIHGSLAHLVANTLPLWFLGTLAFWVYPKATIRALPLIWIGSGIGVWLIGRESLHFGMSGVNHGLMFLIFTLGIVRRERRAIAAALATFLLYGGMLITVLPREPSISWESHLCGALMGVLAALLWRALDPAPPRKKYSYELEEELAALQAERDELELPRPSDVPVLWQRPEREPEPRGQVIAFRRPPPDAPVPDPESPTRH